MNSPLDEMLVCLISIRENQLKIGLPTSTDWEKAFSQCAQVRYQRLGDKFNEPITVYDSITGDPKMFILQYSDHQWNYLMFNDSGNKANEKLE